MGRVHSRAVIAGFAVVAAGCLLSKGGEVEHGNVAFDVAPDGKRIVFSSADGDLYLFHLDTRRVDQLTKTQDKESTPALSPDGKSVVYSINKKGRKGTMTVTSSASLFVRTLDGHSVRQLTDEANAADSMPSFSPDGKWITFVRAHRLRPYSLGGWAWDDHDIYVMRSDGTGPRRITHKKYYGAAAPHFALDGKSVIYLAEQNNYPAPSHSLLLEVDASGSEPPHPLGATPPAGLEIGAWVSQPNVSRDGERIAFFSDRERAFSYDLHVMKRDGSDVKRLGITGISKYNQNAVFLRDGKSLLFLAGTEDNAFGRAIFSLWQVDVDGKNPRRIADSGLFTDPLRWNPKP